MTPGRRRGPGLAGKLLLTSAAMLAIPWLGYKTLQATRDFLFQGQAQAQLLSASAVANLFHNRSDLFETPTAAREVLSELPLYRLQSRILLDGLDEDWELLSQRRQSFKGHALSFSLLLGQRDGRLFGLLKVNDVTPVDRHPAHRRLDRSDHLRLYFTDSSARPRRLLLNFEGSGQTSAYEMDAQWRQASANSREHLLRGYIERDPQGYTLEFSMPLNWLGEQRRLGLAVADVDDPQQRQIAELVGTFAGDGDHFNLLVERSAETDRLLQALAPRQSRIWIVDSAGHVKASRGRLDADVETTGTTAASWQGLLDALQTMISKLLLGIPLGPTRDFDPATTPSRQDALLRRALEGEAGVERRAAVAGKGEIIAAAHPIHSADHVIGAVLVEKSTQQVLSLQRQTIERLAVFTLLSIAIVAMALLAFAARLTLRIRRLDRQTGNAIDQYGRLLRGHIDDELDAGDEIGELARSFNAMLAKLQSHQQFLAAIPRTLRHEMHNPLNTISTSLEQLDMEAPAGHSQPLAAARRALLRIGLLVESLSEAASLEQALQSEADNRFDMIRLVQDYTRNRRRRPPCPRLEVTAPPAVAMLRGSDLHIEQLLDKLVDNAIDFATPGSVIELDLSISDQQCVLAISNRGAPIPEHRLGDIFTLMHSSREAGGAQGHFGLGLYIARLITEFHGGRLWAENLKAPSGVVFKAAFPVNR
jgi:dedicated sortase system histidine kinase